MHDNRYIQPAEDGQLTPAESGQGHRPMHISEENNDLKCSIISFTVFAVCMSFKAWNLISFKLRGSRDTFSGKPVKINNKLLKHNV
jgi:hypothetical protein